MKIIVPATSANIGPGFDSVGVALSKYLEIEVLEASESWVVEHDLGSDIPSDERNLLIATALQVEPGLAPHHLRMTSDIPLARGLGSSSSVIVAGIELANQLSHLNLTDQEKLVWANKIEGHPDNVAPAIFGQLVVAYSHEDQVQAVVAPMPNTAFVAFIPSYELKTSDSRNVLPKERNYSEAVAASAIANVAIAALLTGDMVTAGQAIESDLFHEKYRQPLVKEFTQVKELAKDFAAYATYLSGAGPTVMTLIEEEKAEAFLAALEGLSLNGTCHLLHVDQEGVRIEN